MTVGPHVCSCNGPWKKALKVHRWSEHLTRASFTFTGNLGMALTFLRPHSLGKPKMAPFNWALSPLHLTRMNFWKFEGGRRVGGGAGGG